MIDNLRMENKPHNIHMPYRGAEDKPHHTFVHIIDHY